MVCEMRVCLIIALVVLTVLLAVPAVKYLYLMVWDRYRPPVNKKDGKELFPRAQQSQSATKPRPMPLTEVEQIVNDIKFREIQ